MEAATESNGLPWALQRLKKKIIFNVFCACNSKTQENKLFFILLAPGEQSPGRRPCPLINLSVHVLRASGSGGGPIGRKTFENKPPVQAKQQVLKKLTFRLDKTFTFEVADPA